MLKDSFENAGLDISMTTQAHLVQQDLPNFQLQKLPIIGIIMWQWPFELPKISTEKGCKISDIIKAIFRLLFLIENCDSKAHFWFYTAIQIRNRKRCCSIENQKSPIYVVNWLFSRCSERWWEYCHNVAPLSHLYNI